MWPAARLNARNRLPVRGVGCRDVARATRIDFGGLVAAVLPVRLVLPARGFLRHGLE